MKYTIILMVFLDSHVFIDIMETGGSVKMDIRYAIAEYVTADEIKAARLSMGLTQKEFAQFIGTSKPTIERWETSGKNITGPIVLLLKMLMENPYYRKKLEIPPKETPLRIYYMYKQNICTLMDVDEMKRLVRIRNYTNRVMFRAFGTVEEPTYEEFEEFLESRCFPRTRDKIKLYLKELGIPFYDPLLIVEKTEGRMAEDDFWLKIVR